MTVRKRRRHEEEQEESMDIDKTIVFKMINDLTSTELIQARQIVLERFHRILFLDLAMTEKLFERQQSILDHPCEMVMVSDTRIPAVIYYSSLFIQQNIQDGLFLRRVDPLKLTAMRSAMVEVGIHEFIGNCGTEKIWEMSDLLLEALKDQSPFVPQQLHAVYKGILALNNSSKGLRMPSAGILKPNEKVVLLLRDSLILLTIEKRNILHWIIKFIIQLCRLSTKMINASCRHYSSIFGPLILLNEQKTTKTSEWCICWFELLLHAHGLSPSEEAKSKLWQIDRDLEESIQEKVQQFKTPRRQQTPRRSCTTPRRLSCTTPRRRQNILGRIVKTVHSDVLLESPTNFRMTFQGETYGSPASDHGIQRDRFAKRIRTAY